MRGTVSGIRSLYGLFKVLKCNHQHGHFCHFVYIEYYSAGDIFTKFVKFYPLARFASSRCSELSAAFGDLRACYRGRVRITVALASAVIEYIYIGDALGCKLKEECSPKLYKIQTSPTPHLEEKRLNCALG